MKFIPTLEQLDAARQKLPNPNGFRGGDHYAVVVDTPFIAWFTHPERFPRETVIRTLLFKRECHSFADASGRQDFMRWHYNDEVQC